MPTKDETDAVYGVKTDERFRLLLEEYVEQTRRLADTLERLNDILESDKEATTR